MRSTKSKTTHEYSWGFDAIGTRWQISSTLKIAPKQRKDIEAIIEDFDAAYSRFRTDSIVSSMAKRAGEYTLPHSPRLFGLYEALYDLTQGRVTPLVGGVLEDMGYDASYSFKRRAALRSIPDLHKAVKRTEDRMSISEPVVIDVGAAGKGLLVDLMYEYLEGKGHMQFVVDGSGDMRVSDDSSEQVGLEHPADPGRVIGAVKLNGRSLCASATNRRAWQDGHHIVDPLTKKPVKDIRATWVIADTTLLADGLATALFFVEPQVLRTRYNYEYVRLHNNGGVEYSSYFEGRLF